MQFFSDLEQHINSYYQLALAVIPKIFIAVIICTLLWFVLKVLANRILAIINRQADDQLLVDFAGNALRLARSIIIILMFMYIVGLGGIASSALGAAGISAFVIGFAFKDIGENFLAGVIMAFNRPFVMGDTIKSMDIEGKIVQMNLRDTRIKTFDGKDVYIPNGQIIKNPLFNYTIDGYIRKEFTVGVDYGSDLDKARKIILDTLKKEDGIIQDDRPPVTLIQELGASTINIVIQYWVNTFNPNYDPTELQSQVMKKVVLALDANGVAMPSDILEIKRYSAPTVKHQEDGSVGFVKN